MTKFRRIREILLACPDVRLAYVFGSAAQGKEQAASDVDLGVLFTYSPDAAALQRLTSDLETAAGRSVDLVLLANAPPHLAHEIITRGDILVFRDDSERVRFEARVTARYLDTRYLRRVQLMYLRERIETRRVAST